MLKKHIIHQYQVTVPYSACKMHTFCNEIGIATSIRIREFLEYKQWLWCTPPLVSYYQSVLWSFRINAFFKIKNWKQTRIVCWLKPNKHVISWHCRPYPLLMTLVLSGLDTSAIFMLHRNSRALVAFRYSHYRFMGNRQDKRQSYHCTALDTTLMDHYDDVIMSAIASQITSLIIV